MSIDMYNALLLAVKEEVCSSLCLAGFGDLDSMLKALNMSRSDSGGEGGGCEGGEEGEGGGEAVMCSTLVW